jgi:hypothetical protein
MAKSKKTYRDDRSAASPPDETAIPLSELEVEVSLVCLRYFRGDWDMYLDYLQGPRVTSAQRAHEIPVVESLRDRDRRIEYLTTFLEDEVVALAQRLSFDSLLRIWEHALELDPESEPFPEFRGEIVDEDGEVTEGESPTTLH